MSDIDNKNPASSDAPKRRKLTLSRKSSGGEKSSSGLKSGAKSIQVAVKHTRSYTKEDMQRREQEDKELEQARVELALQREAEKTEKEPQEDVAKEQGPAGETSEAAKDRKPTESKPETAEEKLKTFSKKEPAVTKEVEVDRLARLAQKKARAAAGRRQERFDYTTSLQDSLGGRRGEDGLYARGRRKFSTSKVSKKIAQGFSKPTSHRVQEVTLPESITVAELAQKMSIKAAAVIKVLMGLGSMATINQAIDQETAILVVEELGHSYKLIDKGALEESMIIEHVADKQGEPVSRPPVVTIMGHVDHGKTSLLDYIRRTHVTAKEAGGITQHIGAYHVKTTAGIITFLDTPGHAAFTAMRARGAKCTDLVVLVVAADDGVMPQTVEAIMHARAAGVPMVVAVNKIDKPDADLDRIRNELSQQGIVSEEWGGDVIFQMVSAKTGQGIEDLLGSILLQAEVLELKAPDTGPAKGVVIESYLDKGRGPVATILVTSGCLRRGDILLTGSVYGRIRAMTGDDGRPAQTVTPSLPVEVLGLSAVPIAGDEIYIVSSERKAREIALFRASKTRQELLSKQQAVKLDDLFSSMQEGKVSFLNIILKSDVQGSLEAIMDGLHNLSTNEVKVRVVASGVGAITESDVHLAIASHAVLIGFNVRAENSARQLVTKEGVDLRYYSIIYNLIDEVKAALSGLLSPEVIENIVGMAQVRDVFRSSKLGAIAGCLVTEGRIKKSLPIRVLRDHVVIYEGELESLRRFKDDVGEVQNGTECGIGVKDYNDIKSGDQIEVFERVIKQRTLD